jgi:hypothetical protein
MPSVTLWVPGACGVPCGADVSVRNLLPAGKHSGQRFGAVQPIPRSWGQVAIHEQPLRL